MKRKRNEDEPGKDYVATDKTPSEAIIYTKVISDKSDSSDLSDSSVETEMFAGLNLSSSDESMNVTRTVVNNTTSDVSEKNRK